MSFSIISMLNDAVTAAPTTVSLLVTYGPMGIILAWFMFRNENKIERVTSEIRGVGHRIDGLTRALLADVISRDTTNHKAREIAQTMLTEMESKRTDGSK